MGFLRRRLGLWVAATLVFQVASLSALVPRDCCAAHGSASKVKAPCHEEPAASHCPLGTRDAETAACPMHGSSHQEAEQGPGSSCSMRGACDGPMAALFALLSNYGVLTDSYEMRPATDAPIVVVVAREYPIARHAPPDPPPPRA
jgi:hypothetical protein